MEDVNPSGIRDADPYLTAGAIRYAGGDWVVPADTDLFASYDGFAGPLSAFDATTSGSSLDVTIDGGEGFVGGSWLATDEATTVTLVAQTDTQRVYAGWNQGTTGDVLVGLDSAFGATDPKMPIWEFDTDGSGVSASSDLRALEERIDVRNEGSAANADNLGNVPPEDYVRGDGSTTDSRVFVNSSSDFAVGNPNHASAYYLWGRQDLGILRLGNGVINTQLYNYVDADGYDLQNVGTMSATNANVGGSPVLTDADESGLNVSTADNATNADNIGQNSSADVNARSTIEMHKNPINGLPAANYGGQAVSRDYADSRYIEQTDESGLDVSSADTAATATGLTHRAIGHAAQQNPTQTPAYVIEPGKHVIIGRFNVPTSVGGHHLWQVGTQELDGRDYLPQFKIFNRQDGLNEQIFTTNDDYSMGDPIHSNYRDVIELRIKNSDDTDTIRATATYALTYGDL